MSREVRFRSVVTAISADEKKVVAKMFVDPSDVSAHEDLLHLRGRRVVVTVEEEQLSLEDGDYE